MFKLECQAQNYAWGKPGNKSAVASLLQNTVIDSDQRYAELWMGTHPSGPSYVISEKSGEKSLLSDIRGEPLPFLFKVLSVDTALSIQAHPDLELAGKLHAERPQIYKDPNHKPEMAVALTPFEAMCGFRHPEEIVTFLETVPEFVQVVGEKISTEFKRGWNSCKNMDQDEMVNAMKPFIKQLFTAFIFIDKEIAAQIISNYVSRVSGDSQPEETICRLSKQYPGDPGAFAPFFLNLFKLEPGEALFLGPNLPHAYLSGDCMECMAASDNVVRAGLTPKFVDSETLCSMLTYECVRPELLKPKSLDENNKVYIPPVREFCLHKLNVAQGEEYTLHSSKDSILIVLSGSGNFKGASNFQVSKGSIVFVSTDEDVQISSQEALEIYQCRPNSE